MKWKMKYAMISQKKFHFQLIKVGFEQFGQSIFILYNRVSKLYIGDVGLNLEFYAIRD